MAQQHNRSSLPPLPPGLPPRSPGSLNDWATSAPQQEILRRAHVAHNQNRTTRVGSLPVELVENVAAYVASLEPWVNDYQEDGPRNSKYNSFRRASQDLRNMALACTHFRNPAQERLFRAPFLHAHVTKDIPFGERCTPYYMRVPLLLRTLFSRPDLARKVQELRFDIHPGFKTTPHEWVKFREYVCVYKGVIDMCLKEVQKMPIYEPRKKILELDLIHQWPVAMMGVVLNLVSNLKHLTIDQHYAGDAMDYLFGKVQDWGGQHFSEYWDYRDPHVGSRIEGIANLPGVARLRTLRLEMAAKTVRFDSLRAFVPPVETLDLLLLPYHWDLFLAGLASGTSTVPGGTPPLSNSLRAVTHLRIDGRIQQVELRAGQFLGHLQHILLANRPLRNLEVYGEPPSYQFGLLLRSDHQGPFPDHRYGLYKSSFLGSTFQDLLAALSPLRPSLTTLKMPRGFWTLRRVDPVPGACFANMSQLEELDVPKEMLVGTPRNRDPQYEKLVQAHQTPGKADEPEPTSIVEQLPRSLRVLAIFDMDASASKWIDKLLSVSRTGLPELTILKLGFVRGIAVDEKERILEKVEEAAAETMVTVEVVE